MNVPPTFEQAPQYQPPKKQNNLPRILLLVFVFVCVPCVLILFFGSRLLLNVAKKGMSVAGCSFSLSSARDAMVDYSKDHNGKLPPMADWQKEIFPYYQKHVKKVTAEMDNANDFIKDLLDLDMMKDPAKPFGCATDDDAKRTTFVYNSKIAGLPLAEVRKNAETKWIFESMDGGVSVSKPAPDKLDDASAPKLMGSVRGWFWIKGEGDSYLRNREFSEGNIKVRIEEEKAKQAEKAAAEKGK
ncbi:MAG: hypothetical protein JNJ45_06330 [Chthonomonas sp.]|nr:hypothetical protein [Chthonomonas sp.]